MHSTQRPIVFGQVASLSGSNYMGSENRDGSELAVAQLNDAGGVLGRPVALCIEDDRSMPQGAVEAYRRLVEHGAVAVIGTSFSNASLAVLEHTDRLRVVYVSTGAAHTQVAPVWPYVFMTPPTGHLVATQLLRYLSDSGVGELAVVFDADSAFNREAWAAQQDMLERFGIEAVTVQAVRVNTENFEPTLAAVADSPAQAVMAWVTGPPATGLARAFRAAGVDIPLVAGLGAASPAFVSEVGAAADGIVVATSLVSVRADLPPSAICTAIDSFTEPFQRHHGIAPSQFAVDGYTATMLIAAAVEAAGSEAPDVIRAAMESLSCSTPEGEYHFSATDHSGLVADDVAVAIIRDGNFRLTQWSRDRLRTHLA
ncbi:ABC transporter substrate-binding protein [Mycolicibacterium sp. J2]|jgi:branched-chain amino acid transport system substrate-binding protein|uniref:ABC transporter substrate-binding protein n=1 Tax=Mycolicibacterium sp. J2 TaxID=2993511 RepID=UPI00224B8C3A|nr:ABC transporter substrate-binding protein [Mycolicibacterium sp. J2]MCX2713447.1 ABC transporter substrate-binding protein [Mycolicibacterium sp. J2]